MSRWSRVKLVICMLLFVIVTGIWQEKLYGNRKIVEFPFDKVSELPEEPDWYHENAFADILQYQSEQKEMQTWFESIYTEQKYVVNESGDPIPLRNFRIGSMFGLTFFNHNGNVVVISSDCSEGLKRMEIFKKSVKEGEKQYCCIEEKIVDERNKFYIDYENNNTLYYYVNNGTPQVIKIDEDVSQIDGWYNDFPILKKDGEIYSYVLEGVDVRLPGFYSYRVGDISIKKVNFSDLEGICKIEKWFEWQNLTYKQEETHVYISIYLRDILKDGQYNIEEIFSLLQSDVFLNEKPKEKEKIYLNRFYGYDDESLW